MSSIPLRRLGEPEREIGPVVAFLCGPAAAYITGADLVVGFNANATVARVQNLLRALTYNNSNNTNPDLGPRSVRVTINDGDGGAPG